MKNEGFGIVMAVNGRGWNEASSAFLSSVKSFKRYTTQRIGRGEMVGKVATLGR